MKKYLLLLFLLAPSVSTLADANTVCTPDMTQPGSPTYVKKCHDDIYKQQWLDNQRQQLELDRQKLEQQKRMDEYNMQFQKQQMRQQKIVELQRQCGEKTANQRSGWENSVCNAIDNHFKYGLPLSDEQIGLK